MPGGPSITTLRDCELSLGLRISSTLISLCTESFQLSNGVVLLADIFKLTFVFSHVVTILSTSANRPKKSGTKLTWWPVSSNNRVGVGYLSTLISSCPVITFNFIRHQTNVSLATYQETESLEQGND